MRKVFPPQADRRGQLVLAGTLVLFFTWQATHLGGFQWDADEGINLMKGWLLALGEPLYTRIWADQPPAFTALLAFAFRLAGPSVTVGRLVALFHATLCLLAVAWVVWELDSGSVGALAAVVLLALAPNFFWASRAVMIGLPAISLAMLSMAMLLAYLRDGRWGWLAGAGLIFALSLLEKLVVIYWMIPMGLIVVLRQGEGRDWRSAARDLTLLGLAVLLPLLLVVLINDTRAFWDQVVNTYFLTKTVYGTQLNRSWTKLRYYLWVDNFGLLGATLYGLGVLLWRRTAPAVTALVWLAVTLVALMTHWPIWPKHHFLPLLILMAILSGLAVNQTVRLLGRLRDLVPVEKLALLAGLSALALTLVGLSWMLRVDSQLLTAYSYETKRYQRIPEPRSYGSAQAAVRYLQATTRPDEEIVTDYQMIAFRAARRVPPELAVTSGKRIKLGLLTADDLMATTSQAPAAVVFWDEKLTQFPSFVAWVEGHYRLAQVLGTHHRVYERRVDPAVIQQPQPVTLGDRVTFLGYDPPVRRARPGETLHFTLYWQAREPLAKSYTVFTHLLKDGRLWGQRDQRPAGGFRPTNEWQPGEVIRDLYALEIPPMRRQGSTSSAWGCTSGRHWSGCRPSTRRATGCPRTAFPWDGWRCGSEA